MLVPRFLRISKTPKCGSALEEDWDTPPPCGLEWELSYSYLWGEEPCTTSAGSHKSKQYSKWHAEILEGHGPPYEKSSTHVTIIKHIKPAHKHEEEEEESIHCVL